MSDGTTMMAEPRERIGKGGARATRRAGRVPGVIYGDNKQPAAISLDAHGLNQEIVKPGFLTTLLEIKVNGETHRVLPREVQLHPVTDAPLHVDFQRVSATTRLTIAIPVRFINEEECDGLRRGGVVNVVRHEVDLMCTAANIPRAIEADLAGLDIGDSIHISNIELPEGVRPAIADRDFTIATLAAPTVAVVEEEEAEEEELEGEEGEVEAPEGEAEPTDPRAEKKPTDPRAEKK